MVMFNMECYLVSYLFVNIIIILIGIYFIIIYVYV